MTDLDTLRTDQPLGENDMSTIAEITQELNELEADQQIDDAGDVEDAIRRHTPNIAFTSDPSRGEYGILTKLDSGETGVIEYDGRAYSSTRFGMYNVRELVAALNSNIGRTDEGRRYALLMTGADAFERINPTRWRVILGEDTAVIELGDRWRVVPA